MPKILQVFLGILTAIGGFVDIGELVTVSTAGSRFGVSLAWATLLAVLCIVVFAEMSGRVAAVSGRAVMDVVRERLGAKLAFANLLASFVITVATVAAEVGGVALSLQLATSVNYLLWVPVVVMLLWVIVWRASFDSLENVLGILGLSLLVITFAVWRLHPDFGALLHQASHPAIPSTEGAWRYAYFAVGIFGAGIMPYEVFFFSSGAVEDRWTEDDIGVMRANVLIGFPLGAILTLSLLTAAALVLLPRGIQVTQLFQTALTPSLAVGRIGLCVAILGFVACTFGAAVETMLSCGYMVGQHFGWQWGKRVRPKDDARFHTVLIAVAVIALLLGISTIDPVKLTEYVVVLSAVALPLTYLPVLIAANDPELMGKHANRRFGNAMGVLSLVIVMIAALAAIPLMVITKAGG